MPGRSFGDTFLLFYAFIAEQGFLEEKPHVLGNKQCFGWIFAMLFAPISKEPLENWNWTLAGAEGSRFPTQGWGNCTWGRSEFAQGPGLSVKAEELAQFSAQGANLWCCKWNSFIEQSLLCLQEIPAHQSSKWWKYWIQNLDFVFKICWARSLFPLIHCCVLSRYKDGHGQRTKRNSRLPWSLSIDLSDHNCEGNCIKIIKTPIWTIEHQLSQIIFASVQLCVPSFAKVNDCEFRWSAEGFENIPSPKGQPWSQEKKSPGIKTLLPPQPNILQLHAWQKWQKKPGMSFQVTVQETGKTEGTRAKTLTKCFHFVSGNKNKCWQIEAQELGWARDPSMFPCLVFTF